MNNNNYLTYGAKVNAESVSTLLRHALDQAAVVGATERPTPVCIWGLHGIGKTELVRALATERNCRLVYIAPAQFEEMGDLIGMPRIAGDTTRFAPPEWVPQEEGPGILLLDDANRADDRILRGVMQLLQYYELVSWQLPAKWLIVLTANPDGGDYSVTPMDEAMLNRMLHVTMEFDVRMWARWAESAGMDERGITFVLTYPELVNGRRTTPRSLVQFFNLIRPIDNLQDQLGLVKILGESCLEAETVQAFVNFVHLKLDQLPSPEQILDSDNFDALAERLSRLTRDGNTLRLDILSVVTTRLSNFLTAAPERLTESRQSNLIRFLLLNWLPNDLRLAMAQELTQSPHPNLRRLLADPNVGALLLNRM